ncbi:MAG: carboxypeptidase-like regulatory domain-containing protein, partial [Muribaculaceae bacterium]|nr:carboxypeptidase-like regulatory domain-containing protein [Muribaculaceae bacterium]
CVTGCANSNDVDFFGAVHGTVTDYADGKPLENAAVVISPGGLTRTTDVEGYYSFSNLESRQYTITVQRGGYKPDRKQVTLLPGEDLQVDIQLSTIQK